ncbi:MAG: MBL fold metallo-hydrolase [Candidatus Dactylopiibacterium sp.]|nr:MBL fold metallo-hydrolase [Candidatus Dactylopiibacterium sp.]
MGWLIGARTPPAHDGSPQFRDGRFRNAVPTPARSLRAGLRLWREFLLTPKPAHTRPARAIALQALSREALLAAPDGSAWRLGHSTLLFRLDGKFWLTDPVFSERASPVQWFGPRRFHAPPIALDALPPIEGVIVSHNHYDHLDRASVRALHARVAHFIVPLGVGHTLRAWGVPAHKVRELDWWQAARVGALEITATPAQHFSGRTPFDGQRTLWASWVLAAPGLRLYFSADTGYFEGFGEIGRRCGPFDVAFLEAGAYDARWAHVHMLPEQTLQAFHDLGARHLVPVHNGTFDLAFHAWNEPFERLHALAGAQGVALCTPRIGERIDLAAPCAGSPWWRE